MARGHSHREMYLLTRMLAVPSAVNSVAVTANNIGPTTETVYDEQDVGVASRRDRKRVEVVYTDGDARTFRERHGDDWPTDSQSTAFPRLALEAVAKPPPGAHVHVDPPV